MPTSTINGTSTASRTARVAHQRGDLLGAILSHLEALRRGRLRVDGRSPLEIATSSNSGIRGLLRHREDVDATGNIGHYRLANPSRADAP